jgi:hypothetical protein
MNADERRWKDAGIEPSRIATSRECLAGFDERKPIAQLGHGSKREEAAPPFALICVHLRLSAGKSSTAPTDNQE